MNNSSIRRISVIKRSNKRLNEDESINSKKFKVDLQRNVDDEDIDVEIEVENFVNFND